MGELTKETMSSRHQDGIVPDDDRMLLGGEGFRLNARASHFTIPPSPILTDIHTIWDTERFKVPRKPILVGYASNREEFAKPLNGRITDIPIKLKGTDYRIPIELLQFKSVIQAIVDFEHWANSHVQDYYAYLTIDQKFLNVGDSHRGIGMHSDGIQGRNICPKTFVEHTYITFNINPTAFFVQPFDMGMLDPDVHYFSSEFVSQADYDNVYYPPNFSITLSDTYSIHKGEPAACSGLRTFLRVSYSTREFVRLGNTHNDLFDYEWVMIPRPIPHDLIGYPRGG